jgi:hypothetical protein
MRKEAAIFIALLTVSVAAVTAVANNAPVVSSLPVVSAATLIADDATVYTVTTTATDADGYADIRDVRVLFNLVDYNFTTAQGRGYLAWGVTDADITKYNDGVWVPADATGGGRWGYPSNNWGGTAYFTPVGCSTTTVGAATGASGSRTVTWSFRVKPAWAANPLTNDADAFTRDNVVNSGWQENLSDFDVVAACSSPTSTPRAPIVSMLTSPFVAVSIDPADSPTDVFAINVTGEGGNRYVQTDGTIGLPPVYQTKTQWGTTTVKGLTSSTTYAITAKAFRNTGGYCPSAYGPATTLTTGILERIINLNAPGRTLSPYLTGNATRLDTFPSLLVEWQKTWDILHNTMARGMGSSDTYNWKDMSGEPVGFYGTPGPDVPTTLAWMCLARDHQTTPLLGANMRGVGTLANSGWCTFDYVDRDVSMLAQLATDYVRYVNVILPTYRQGDMLPPGDQAILDSINWYGRPKLLAPGEAATPHVTYWEIGNEPELSLPWCTPGAVPNWPLPAEFASRYKQITTAMLAVDPTIKVGPCITTASNGVDAYLAALLPDQSARVDFISYHPYGPLYGYAQQYGDTEATAEQGLRYVRKMQTDARNGIRSAISASGRNPDSVSLIASEWNASDWHWEGSPEIRRVSHGLGSLETLWTFGDLGLLGATYWSWPAWASDGTETPLYKGLEVLQQHLGATLIDTFTDDAGVHVYTSRKANGDAAIWALNLSRDTDKSFRMQFTGQVVEGFEVLQLANVNGETQLFDTNEPPATAAPTIDWINRPSPIDDGTSYMVTLPHSTATVILVHHRQGAEGDFDLDGDVDQADFGHLQACLTGTYVLQTDPACANAMLSNNVYVDGADVLLFLRCMQGPGVIVLPGCSQ